VSAPFENAIHGLKVEFEGTVRRAHAHPFAVRMNSLSGVRLTGSAFGREWAALAVLPSPSACVQRWALVPKQPVSE